MKVKKITARSMDEAMQLVKREIGEDAVVLNTRMIEKGGIFGFFTKKYVQVIAASDTPDAQNEHEM
ncbi:MAG: flagellar biosynthesis protein FlhF, partial [Bacilli bacterium]